MSLPISPIPVAEAGQNGVAAGTRSEEPGAVCLVTLVASECCMPCLRSLWRCVHWLGVVVSLTGMAIIMLGRRSSRAGASV